jgi:hypothetical protein
VEEIYVEEIYMEENYEYMKEAAAYIPRVSSVTELAGRLLGVLVVDPFRAKMEADKLKLPWTEGEKNVFDLQFGKKEEDFGVEGKDFKRIATCISDRTIGDCLDYFYMWPTAGDDLGLVRKARANQRTEDAEVDHASRCAGTIRLNDVSTRDDHATTKNTGVAGDAATDEEEEEESAEEEDGDADEAERRPAARKTLATVQHQQTSGTAATGFTLPASGPASGNRTPQRNMASLPRASNPTVTRGAARGTGGVGAVTILRRDVRGGGSLASRARALAAATQHAVLRNGKPKSFASIACNSTASDSNAFSTTISTIAPEPSDDDEESISDDDESEESSDDEVENVHDKDYTLRGDQRCNISSGRKHRRSCTPSILASPAVPASAVKCAQFVIKVKRVPKEDSSAPYFDHSVGLGDPSGTHFEPSAMVVSTVIDLTEESDDDHSCDKAPVVENEGVAVASACPKRKRDKYLVDRARTFTEANVREDDIMHTDDDEPGPSSRRPHV